MERTVAVRVCNVDLGSVLHQLLQHRSVPIEAGQMDRGLTVLVLGVNVPVAAGKQFRHHHVISFHGCPVEKVLSAVEFRIWWGRLARNEVLDTRLQFSLTITAIVINKAVQTVDNFLIITYLEESIFLI